METRSELYDRLKTEVFIIAGPCVMESYAIMDEVASKLVELQKKLKIQFVFKSSFDKANRTSIRSFRGPGLEKGMQWMDDIKSKHNIPITTDIHESWQAKEVGMVADILQIPAFLCRQTDLVVAAAKTRKIVNLKKAQFLSADDMIYPIEKIMDSGNQYILLTERGTIMSPGNLVVDFRNIALMKKYGFPVIMDCTHSVQKPGGGKTTGGNREYILPIAQSAKAFGAQGFFFEVHPNPPSALSDGPNMLYLEDFELTLNSIL
jgi:2-dehydro-3-deoxyphosphooctonate aldolase (KDO 8-P synthase)